MKIAGEQEMMACGERLAERLLAEGRGGSVELVGDVGAGKTTFTRGLARGLGVSEAVASPSYTISRRYGLPGGGELVHYDFYRLPEPGLMAEELAETLGEPGNVVVVEWGQSIAEMLPAERYRVNIEIGADGVREVIIEQQGKIMEV